MSLPNFAESTYLSASQDTINLSAFQFCSLPPNMNRVPNSCNCPSPCPLFNYGLTESRARRRINNDHDVFLKPEASADHAAKDRHFRAFGFWVIFAKTLIFTGFFAFFCAPMIKASPPFFRATFKQAGTTEPKACFGSLETR